MTQIFRPRAHADFAALVEEDPPEPSRWAEFERRKAEWLKANPGHWPGEFESFCAQLAEELKL